MQLTQHTEISHLAAYSGWNTAENTLGTVLVQAAIYSVAKKQGLTPAREKAQLEFLFMRLLDDFCYQALCFCDGTAWTGLKAGGACN